MKFPNDSKGGCIDKGTPKIFRYLRGEKATRGNFNFKGGVKTLAETMDMITYIVNQIVVEQVIPTE